MTDDYAKPDEFTLTLDPADWALVSFYARKKRQRPAEIMHWMINLYTNADRRFDTGLFLDFVRNELMADLPTSVARDRLLRQAVQYTKDRHLADETTASQATLVTKRRKPTR